MPYANINDLPDKVKNNLPKHGQEIYQKAFNNAWDEYKESSKKRDPRQSREETAHRVAWNAVKKKYYKGEDGNWHQKD